MRITETEKFVNSGIELPAGALYTMDDAKKWAGEYRKHRVTKAPNALGSLKSYYESSRVHDEGFMTKEYSSSSGDWYTDGKAWYLTDHGAVKRKLVVYGQPAADPEDVKKCVIGA